VDKLIVITWTAFQETLRRRVFYIVALLALLVIIAISSEMFFMRMARKAGETVVVFDVGRQMVEGIFGIWDFAALFLALFLGAIAVSSEISAKTIMHVMSHPVQRWVYLLSRWIGVLLFLFAFLTIGTVGALGVSVWLHVPFASALWLAIAEIHVRAVFFSGVALGLSVFMPPMLAGVLTFLLSILPAILRSATHDPRWIYRLPALIGYYLAPAHMPVNLMEESFAKERLHTDYALYLRVLAENLCYTLAVILIAAVIFRRREVRVR
jgi:ABC-type transport system involved in multi-copper enzyme maturation permease subunit